jgi:hypothetical protein
VIVENIEADPGAQILAAPPAPTVTGILAPE